MFAYISHPDCLDHNAGPYHPDTAERLNAISDQVIASGLDFVIRRYDAPRVERAQLERVHDPAYLDRIYAAAPRDTSISIDGDTVMSPGTLRAAERAAGAGILGVDLIMRGEIHAGFCAVRPPGHHAEHDKAMGFCLFNNIAVAAAHALEAYGLSRVAIVDFDVHHGNGTEEMFQSDPRVLFCSAFQHPFYPFTGAEPLSNNMVAIPLPAGTNGAAYRQAVSDRWIGALNDFQPEFVFVSAGFDAHAQDDMSSLSLVESDYRWLTQQLVSIARAHAQGRILSMLEGGYDPNSLARAAVGHIKVMTE